MIQGMTSYLLKNTNKLLKIIKKLKSQLQQADLIFQFFLSTDFCYNSEGN